jgi:hypothetical protein
MRVPMMMSWVYVPSLVKICQRAAEAVGCRDQTVLNLKNLFNKSSMAWRSSVPSFEMIGQHLWQEMHFEGFWHKPRWRKIHNGAKRRQDALNSAWTKHSNDSLFVNIGRLGRPAPSACDLSSPCTRVWRRAIHFFLLPIRFCGSQSPSWLFPFARYWLV